MQTGQIIERRFDWTRRGGLEYVLHRGDRTEADSMNHIEGELCDNSLWKNRSKTNSVQNLYNFNTFGFRVWGLRAGARTRHARKSL